MRTIRVRVRRDRPGRRFVLTALAVWLAWSVLVSAVGTAGGLALIGAVFGVGGLAVVAVDRVAARLAVPLAALWLGLASVSLLVAALVVQWGGAS